MTSRISKDSWRHRRRLPVLPRRSGRSGRKERAPNAHHRGGSRLRALPRSGALHVERHTAGERGTGDVDYTIVNPSHLSRELSEAICQQCHLPATTSVPARGRDLTDFRPGRRLEDFWHVYQVAGKNTTMKVVGHVEQLHLSRCYQESKTLTCLTCHDPHDEEPADRRGPLQRHLPGLSPAGALHREPGAAGARKPGQQLRAMPHAARRHRHSPLRLRPSPHRHSRPASGRGGPPVRTGRATAVPAPVPPRRHRPQALAGPGLSAPIDPRERRGAGTAVRAPGPGIAHRRAEGRVEGRRRRGCAGQASLRPEGGRRPECRGKCPGPTRPHRPGPVRRPRRLRAKTPTPGVTRSPKRPCAN